MDIIKVSSNGQIIIPPYIRRKFSIQDGDSLIISVQEENITLHPLARLSDMRGSLCLNGWQEILKEMRAEKDE